MDAITVTGPDRNVLFGSSPTPSPKPGEVLIKVVCAPVNPADRMTVEGVYVENPDPPFIPGLCGVGVVIGKRGAGLLGAYLMGRRVVFAPGAGREGSWAQYAVAPPSLCLPLPGDFSDTDGVNLIANAMTALGLVQQARESGARAILLNGAAGEVGRLVNAAAGGMSVVNIVRTTAQAEAMQGAGHAHVLSMSDDDFPTRLRALAAQLRVTAAIDAVAGPMTKTLLQALPDGGLCIVYGRLSGEEIRFDGLTHLVGRRQRLVGFNINHWLMSLPKLTLLLKARQAADLLRQTGGTRVKEKVELAELTERYAALAEGQSIGKTVVYPNGMEESA